MLKKLKDCFRNEGGVKHGLNELLISPIKCLKPDIKSVFDIWEIKMDNYNCSLIKDLNIVKTITKFLVTQTQSFEY